MAIASFPGPTKEEERAWYTLFVHAPHHHGNTSRGHRPITGLVGSKVGNYEIPVRAIRIIHASTCTLTFCVA